MQTTMKKVPQNCLMLKTTPLNTQTSTKISKKKGISKYRRSSFTPDVAILHWSSADKVIAKIFLEEIYKVISFGIQTDTLHFRREDGIELLQSFICPHNELRNDKASRMSIVGVALFPEWRVRRIEWMVLVLMKRNKWNVRSVKICCAQDLAYLTVKWEVDLPEERNEYNSQERDRVTSGALDGSPIGKLSPI